MLEENIDQIMGKEGTLLFKEEVALLEELKQIISQNADEQALLDNLLAHIGELFLLVVVGEVKSGKSSFVNTLLGKKICKEGVTPVTDKIHILRYGEQESVATLENFVMEHRYPFEPLKNLNIVDTPGTNSLVLEHQQITEKFIPRSDLVLFITSIDRPFTESERKFLEFIKDLWGKKIVFILSKVDMKTPEEVEEVTQFIKENCKKLLHFEPILFPISARQALESKTNHLPELWEKSQFGAVEDYIFRVLSQGEKIKLKLSGILFNALKIVDKSINNLNKKQEMLEMDKEVISETNKLIGYEERILKHNYTAQVEKIKNPLADIESWGKDFLQKNLKMAQLFLLLKKKKQAALIDEDKLRPLGRISSQNMEKALEILFSSFQNLEVQVLESFEKKFQGAFSEVKKNSSTKISRQDCIKEIEELIKEKISPSALVEYSCQFLKNAQKKVLCVLGGIIALTLVAILVKLIDISWFTNLIALGMIGVSLWAFFSMLPKFIQKVLDDYKKYVESIGKEIRAKMEGFYKKAEQSILSPLRSIIEQREKTLLDSQNNHSQKKTEIEAFIKKAKAFQSKLDSLDSTQK